MKSFITILFLFVFLFAGAQSRKERKMLDKSEDLEKIVFGSKEKEKLEKLFAKTLVYGHSSGKLETREEAIQGIVNNKSVYEKSKEYFARFVYGRADSIVVEHVFKATEKKADGSVNPLDITIELVWAKEDKVWKLFRRQARKNIVN